MVAPDRGDLVTISIDRRADGASGQRRPAVVVSPAKYNAKAGLAIMCAVAQHALGDPFEVALPRGLPVSGVILADHLKSTDWRARDAQLVCRLPAGVIAEVMAKLKPI